MSSPYQDIRAVPLGTALRQPLAPRPLSPAHRTLDVAAVCRHVLRRLTRVSRRTTSGRDQVRDERADAPCVPVRALTLSFAAMVAAIVAAVFWTEALLEQDVLAGELALIPGLLLAHYRRWTSVAAFLALGMIALAVGQVALLYLQTPFNTSYLVLFVLTPYIAIALGAGWFGEVRRYQATLRATQLQLIQAEKLESLGRMAAGVAHEVKNPLMIILTGVKLLGRRLNEPDENTRLLLREMKEAVGRADRIIGELLNYSRARRLDLASVDVNALVDTSLLLLRHEIDATRIRVVKELDASVPALELDAFKIQQVLVNVLTNALQATAHDGVVTLRTSSRPHERRGGWMARAGESAPRSAGAVIIEIEDSGPGIPAEYLDKLFDPFFTTKPTGVGTGLGLAVARQIVDMHGGTIQIENRATGGARVTIAFDIAQPGAGHEQAAHSPRR